MMAESTPAGRCSVSVVLGKLVPVRVSVSKNACGLSGRECLPENESRFKVQTGMAKRRIWRGRFGNSKNTPGAFIAMRRRWPMTNRQGSLVGKIAL